MLTFVCLSYVLVSFIIIFLFLFFFLFYVFYSFFFFFFQAEDGIRDTSVTGVQTCALPIWLADIGQQRAGDEVIALNGNTAAKRLFQHVRNGDALPRAGIEMLDEPHVDVAG